jgi:uncharacterized iron-regulated protein
MFTMQYAFCQTSGTDFKLYDAHLKKEVFFEEIAEKMQKGEVLVFGEQHDDSVGHLMEQKILAALYAKHGKEVMLAMEMFHRDVQYIVDEYLAGQISEKNFIKEARAWDTYKTDYRAAVEFAKERGLRVIAANTPSRYANIVTRKGLGALNTLSKPVRKNYLPPLPIDTAIGKYYDNFLEAMGGHSMPGMNLYQSQNLWDATMSWSIAQAMKSHKNAMVFMMNGRFHSDYHLGLVKRLETDYKKKVVTISCFAADDFDYPNWKKYAPQADYIIITKPKTTKEAGTK